MVPWLCCVSLILQQASKGSDPGSCREAKVSKLSVSLNPFVNVLLARRGDMAKRSIRVSGPDNVTQQRVWIQEEVNNLDSFANCQHIKVSTSKVCLFPLLEYKFHEGRDFSIYFVNYFIFVLLNQEMCPAHSRYSISVCWMHKYIKINPLNFNSTFSNVFFN